MIPRFFFNAPFKNSIFCGIFNVGNMATVYKKAGGIISLTDSKNNGCNKESIEK